MTAGVTVGLMPWFKLRSMRAPSLVVALLLLPATLPGALGGDWPQFRGPGGLGLGADTDTFPKTFGPETNVVWKTALPAGNSSPCLMGNRIFLTGFTAPNLETIALDRSTGELLWRRSVAPGPVERGSSLGNPASPTPVSDGRSVFSYFGPFGVVAYDVAGRELWRRPLPNPVTQHGVGTSPILAGGKLIVLRDQDVDSELLALDPNTGDTAWRVARPEFRRGFATPLAYRAGDEVRLLVPGTLRAVIYRADDGAECGSISGLPNEVCASPTAGSGLLFTGGWTPGSGVPRMPAFDQLLAQGDTNKDGKLTPAEAPNGPARQHFPYLDADKDGWVTRAEYDSMAAIFAKAENALLALRPGTGEVTATNLVWKQTRGLPYVPSPLCYRDRLYLVKNGGLISCFNATTGAALFQEERLDAIGDYYASPVAAAGLVVLAAQPGTLVVIRAGDELEVLARNKLGEPIMATPAIADGRLYVRSRDHLWAFGELR